MSADTQSDQSCLRARSHPKRYTHSLSTEYVRKDACPEEVYASSSTTLYPRRVHSTVTSPLRQYSGDSICSAGRVYRWTETGTCRSCNASPDPGTPLSTTMPITLSGVLHNAAATVTAVTQPPESPQRIHVQWRGTLSFKHSTTPSMTSCVCFESDSVQSLHDSPSLQPLTYSA